MILPRYYSAVSRRLFEKARGPQQTLPRSDQVTSDQVKAVSPASDRLHQFVHVSCILNPRFLIKLTSPAVPIYEQRLYPYPLLGEGSSDTLSLSPLTKRRIIAAIEHLPQCLYVDELHPA
jgi:hypothetical protein